MISYCFYIVMSLNHFKIFNFLFHPHRSLGKLKEITEVFNKEGKSDTAIALIQDGSLPSQKIALGTIETIVDIAKEKNIKAPAVIVIGEVVKQHQNFESLISNYQHLAN